MNLHYYTFENFDFFIFIFKRTGIKIKKIETKIISKRKYHSKNSNKNFIVSEYYLKFKESLVNC